MLVQSVTLVSLRRHIVADSPGSSNEGGDRQWFSWCAPASWPTVAPPVDHWGKVRIPTLSSFTGWWSFFIENKNSLSARRNYRFRLACTVFSLEH
jgi:hypothetical protein